MDESQGMHVKLSTRSSLTATLAVAVLVGGCGLGPTGEGPSSSSASSSSTATAAAARDLGPDPGSARYRSLDVCALAPLATLRAGVGGDVETEIFSPGSCSYTATESGETAQLELAPTRDVLPDDVRTTDAGSSEVDTTSAGTVVHDPASTWFYVLSSSGYLLHVEGAGVKTGSKRLSELVAHAVRLRLVKPPPQLSLPATSLSGRDICADGRVSEMAKALGVSERPQTSADGRICDYPQRFWVAFHGRADFPAGFRSTPVTIGSVRAKVANGCQVLIPVAQRPEGAAWEHDSLLARPAPQSGPSCDDFIAALGPLVERLSAG